MVQQSCLPLYSQFVEFNFGWRNKNPDPGTESNPRFTKEPTFEDYEHNGKYCKSGLARRIPDGNTPSQTAECVDAVKIEQNGQKLSYPYECDPTDNDIPCKIYHSETESFDVPCKCALDGQKGKVKDAKGNLVETASRGYCGSILGTPEYADALFYVKEMIFTNRCHTLDKDNASSKFD